LQFEKEPPISGQRGPFHYYRQDGATSAGRQKYTRGGIAFPSRVVVVNVLNRANAGP